MTGHPKHRWRRALALGALTACLMASAAPSARADDPRAELEKAQNKLEYIQKQKETIKNALAQAYWKKEEAKLLLKDVEAELATVNGQLAVVTNQLSFAETSLKKIEADLAVTTKKVAAQKETLARRVRAINEEGRVNYLAVLFGANSFSDFVGRFEMLKMVVQQDSRLFAAFRDTQRQQEEQQKEATTRRDELAALKNQTEAYRNRVTDKRTERQRILAEIDLQQKELVAQVEAFEREEAAMQDEIAAIQRRMGRKAGRFDPILPLARVDEISDWFGPRIDPIAGDWRNHTGVDFAVSEGTPIYAIEDGVVIIARWHDGYGNMVVIDHGGGIASLYAHSSKVLVEVNQQVKRGDKIALVGTTGRSTGPHLHLEIQVDGAAQDPLKWIPQP